MATGVVGDGVVAGVVGASWSLPALLYLAAVSIALALIDLDVHRLPDAIVLPSIPVAAALLAVAALAPGGTGGGSLLRAGIGAVALLHSLAFALLCRLQVGLGNLEGGDIEPE